LLTEGVWCSAKVIYGNLKEKVNGRVFVAKPRKPCTNQPLG
jgi:hypothetical protein